MSTKSKRRSERRQSTHAESPKSQRGSRLSATDVEAAGALVGALLSLVTLGTVEAEA